MKNKKKYHLQNIVELLFKNKKINIFDAGAHKGEFIKKIGEDRVKKAILVDPLDFKITKKKKFKNYKFVNCLLGEKNTKKEFFIYSYKNPEWSSVNKIHKQSPYYRLYKNRLSKIIEKKILNQTTIDKILAKKPFKIDLLKVDCQSQTLEVLLGAKKTISSKNLKIIVCAINNTNFYDKKKDHIDKICKFLKKYKYNFYSIVNAHSGEIGKIDFDFKNFQIWTFDAVFLKDEKIEK